MPMVRPGGPLPPGLSARVRRAGSPRRLRMAAATRRRPVGVTGRTAAGRTGRAGLEGEDGSMANKGDRRGNIAATLGGWRGRHRKTPIVGWLLFAVAAA